MDDNVHLRVARPASVHRSKEGRGEGEKVSECERGERKPEIKPERKPERKRKKEREGKREREMMYNQSMDVTSAANRILNFA